MQLTTKGRYAVTAMISMALAEAIGVRLRPLAGLGHLPQLEDPVKVAIAVLDSFAQDGD